MKYHVFGVGGVGMAPLAKMLSRQHTVSGCDNSLSTTRRRALEIEGVRVSAINDVAHIDNADVVVRSSGASISSPELAAAARRGLPIVTRSELYPLLLRGKRVLAVAGAHGKTSTAECAWRLLAALNRPALPLIGTHGVLLHGPKDSDLVVLEADDSDGSALATNPAVAALTAVDDDLFSDGSSTQGVDELFSDFTGCVTGALFYNGDDRRSLAAVGSARNAVSVGWSPNCDYRLLDRQPGSTDGEEVTVLELATRCRYGIRTPLKGRHGARNGTMAWLLSALGAHVTLSAAAAATHSAWSASQFSRILERHQGCGYRWVDDGADQPAEIAETITAAMEWLTTPPVIIFAPNRYSRLRRHMDQFVDALRVVRRCMLLPVDGKGERRDNAVMQLLAQRLASAAVDVTVHPDVHSCAAALTIEAPTSVLSMGGIAARAVREVWDRFSEERRAEGTRQ